MRKINSLCLILLFTLIVGCSKFPENSTWETKLSYPEDKMDHTIRHTYLNDDKVKVTSKIVQGDKVIKNSTIITSYKVDGNLMKIYDSNRKIWEEDIWKIEGENLIFKSKKYNKEVTYKRIK